MHPELATYTTLIASVPDAPYLTQALDSIQAQTLPPSRVLVIIDSEAPIPDGWDSALQRLHPQVEVIRNPGHGMVTALNYGLAQVTTPLVAFLDSDDLWMPEKQERQVSLLLSDSSVDAVTCIAANVQQESDGSLIELRSAPCSMFTASTFRLATFDRFGALDPESTHFTWLYRWWSRARTGGISTDHIEYVGLSRRLHGGNSWAENGASAHRELLAELRLIAMARRKAAATDESRVT